MSPHIISFKKAYKVYATINPILGGCIKERSNTRTDVLMDPLVSVIIPVYNAETYLADSLNCILNQTLSNIEIICVNDGSTDSSAQILSKYAEMDSRIIIFDREHTNAGAVRNFALKHVRGRYTFFFDADDLCSETLLSETVARAQETDADIVGFDFVRFSDDETETAAISIHYEWIPKNLNIFNYMDCPNKIMSVLYPAPWTKIYRTEFIKANNLCFDEISTSNDITFSGVSLACAHRISFVKKTFVRHRINHAGTITSTKYLRLGNVIRAVQSAAKQVQALPYYQDIKISFLFFAISQYKYTYDQHAIDFSSDSVHEFYDAFHSYFCDQEFSGLTLEQLNNLKLYQTFLSVQKFSYSEMLELVSRKLIVSLTSYPKRIKTVPLCLESIFDQTRQPDQIILWLSEDQFPNKEDELPDQLINYRDSGKLDIRWCSGDIKPHKKYFYAMQEYPDDIIVTIDDDLIYKPDMLDCLYRSYLINPTAISTVRAHLIILSEDDTLLPYNDWPRQVDAFLNIPSIYLFATGGAGALYPPHLLPIELLDEDLIMTLCPNADDLWLKTMQLIADVPVVVSCYCAGLNFIPDTQSDALKTTNFYQGDNDRQLGLINTWLTEKFDGYTWVNYLKTSSNINNLAFPESLNDFIKRLDVKYASRISKINSEKSKLNTNLHNANAKKSEYETHIKELESQVGSLQQQYEFYQHEVDATKASFSFRLGHALTRPVRWLRSVLRK